MKNTAIALTFASLLLTGMPVLAANPVEPSAPSYKTPDVTPNDTRMPLPGFASYYTPYYGFGRIMRRFMRRFMQGFRNGMELPTSTLPIRIAARLERRRRTDAS